MASIIHNRFKDAPWYRETNTDNYIIVGGAGGIGSWLSFLLARAGFYPMLCDFDTIEEHNMGGQLFPREDIGRLKVDSMRDTIKKFSDIDLLSLTDPIQENFGTTRYTLSGFDNMAARRSLFMGWKRDYEGNPGAILMDGRLNAEQMQILCVRGDQPQEIKRYEERYLFSDESVPDAPCTLKQTSHSAAMIAGHMTAFFTNHITNVFEQDQVREVPFFWEYFIPLNLVTTKTADE